MKKIITKCVRRILLTIVTLSVFSFVPAKKSSKLHSRTNAKITNISLSNFDCTVNGYFLGANPQVLPNCSTAPVSFKCLTPDLGTNGTWSFKWTIGSGWTTSGTFVNSSSLIILTPSSPSITPSSVSVVAYFTNNNGSVSGYDVGSCSVTRASTFTSDAMINGNNSLCSGNNIFNITNLPNNATVQWSISGVSGVNIVNQSNSQITLNTNATNGLCTLNAKITNQCGQSITISKVISIGSPNPVIEALRTSDCSFEYRAKDSQFATTNILNHSWELVSSVGFVDFYSNGNLAMINACPPFSAKLRLTTSNSCGNSTVYETDLVLNNYDEEINKQAAPNKLSKFKVYPNPANEVVNVSLAENEFLNSEKLRNLKGEIFDVYGCLKKTFNVKEKVTTVYVKDLPKGVYILKVTTGNGIENQKIVID
ncbi:T9SS type A sorting domain-containing protein [Flavobacterium sp. GCM10023249]|uniref:T9SS type A sorting domain-containing protein n=1 Tax=unclassified Flavobacterium TaxID=196869 RepID=UPI00361CEBBF